MTITQHKSRFSDKEKHLFWNLKFHAVLSTIFSQLTLNVKLLQCYRIFLRSLSITCTKVKNTPQPCDDPTHQRPFQETLHTPSARWGRDPGITSPYAKTQDQYIIHSHINEVLQSVRSKLLVKTASRRNQSFDLLHKLIYWYLHNISPTGGHLRKSCVLA